MGFLQWDSYVELLDRLWQESDTWRSARSFEQFEERIEQMLPELLGGDSRSVVGEYGFTALAQALSEDYADRDDAAARIGFAALSRSAADHGLSEDWSGYFVSRDTDDQLVYCDERYAEPNRWLPIDTVEADADEAPDPGVGSVLTRDEDAGLLYDAEHWYLPDGVTIVELDPDNEGYSRDAAGGLYHLGQAADPATTLFDRASGKWRRAIGTGEFEYFHEADQVWERPGEHQHWTRQHHGTSTWLPYDAPSQTWLYDNQWLPGDRIGAPEPARPATTEQALQEQVRQKVESVLLEMPELAEGLSKDEIAAVIAELTSNVSN